MTNKKFYKFNEAADFLEFLEGKYVTFRNTIFSISGILEIDRRNTELGYFLKIGESEIYLNSYDNAKYALEYYENSCLGHMVYITKF